MDKLYDFYQGNKEKLPLFIDKVNQVKRSYDYVYTDFLTPEEQNLIRIVCSQEFVYPVFYGGKEGFEKAAAVLGIEEYSGEPPVDVLKVTGSFKFEKLSHRDYLGAILSLGIKREKVGDINIFDDGAELYAAREISDYIAYNLKKIKHTGIKIQRINYEDAREKIQEFKDIKINIASLRFDCILSTLIGVSRNDACEVIKSGDARINYITVYEPSKKLSEGDMISIKGYGRFKIDELIGKTKSDRLNMRVKKYL